MRKLIVLVLVFVGVVTMTGCGVASSVKSGVKNRLYHYTESVEKGISYNVDTKVYSGTSNLDKKIYGSYSLFTYDLVGQENLFTIDDKGIIFNNNQLSIPYNQTLFPKLKFPVATIKCKCYPRSVVYWPSEM